VWCVVRLGKFDSVRFNPLTIGVKMFDVRPRMVMSNDLMRFEYFGGAEIVVSAVYGGVSVDVVDVSEFVSRFAPLSLMDFEAFVLSYWEASKGHEVKAREESNGLVF
jgi:hypothetical protein